jgi:glycosyltransferase involved in cell wall biosynthesis
VQHEYYPENFSFLQLIGRWASYRLSLATAAKIQVSSLFIRDNILEKFSFVNLENLFLALEGVDLERFSDNSPDRAPAIDLLLRENSFIYYPAQLWPHKNHLALLESLATFKSATGYEYPCVLSGQDYGFHKKIQQRINELGLNKVFYLGKVPFDQLLWLYKNCAAILALGAHESSSLPIREGAPFGKPLIASKIPPNEEIKDLLNVELVDLSNKLELNEKLIQLGRNNSALIQRGIENKNLIKKFDWGLTVLPFINVFNELSTHKKTTSNFGSAQ